jgi:hypothetical protein
VLVLHLGGIPGCGGVVRSPLNGDGAERRLRLGVYLAAILVSAKNSPGFAAGDHYVLGTLEG